MSSDLDQDLQSYFTDVEHLRDIYKSLVTAQTLTKRLLVIHGVGGVGKSSLLRMFRLHCKSVNVPVALASGDEAKSALDVLARWTDGLKVDDAAFAAFGKTLEHYRAIQAKVDEQAKKAQDARGRAADIAGKAASKRAEAAVGALAGAAIGSVIPGIGTAIGGALGGALGGVLGGMGVDALVDWLRGFLPKPDIDLLLDPAKKLTDDFLADIASAANKRRMVLMLDTFEQMTALDDWVRDVAQRLPANVLFVIAGRALPNWSRAWQSWMATAQVEELKPMTEAVMRDLVRRYYTTMRGGEPNLVQVEAIIRFARGLPMVATNAVQLWVKYGVEDFQSVKTEMLANLVDRLMENVPNGLIPVLEAAASVRWFDQPILRAVAGLADVRDVYDELRRFPFVRVRVEGLALHDAVREIVDENLRAQDSERHCELHKRAAAYFEKQLEKLAGEEAERLGLERLYHRVRADEEAGTQLFQEMAEELVRYRLGSQLQTLMNDVTNYPLEKVNAKLWRDYYNALLARLGARYADAEQLYQTIAQSEPEPKLKAYALADWGWILRRREYIRRPYGKEKALRVLESALNVGLEVDTKLALVWMLLSDVYLANAEWDKALHYLSRAKEFFHSHNAYAEMVQVLRQELSMYGRLGNFRGVVLTWEKIKDMLNSSGNPRYMRAYSKLPIEWFFMGRYSEWVNGIRPVFDYARSTQDEDALIGHRRDLGLALAMQGRCSEAITLLEESVASARNLGGIGELETYLALCFTAVAQFKCGRTKEAETNLLEAINIGQRIRAHLDLGPLYLGIIYEANRQMDKAVEFYQLSLTDARPIQRNYYISAALTGLVRVKHAQGDYAAIPPLLAEAEQLAQQYEYNDHLASLRLTQGILSTDRERISGYETALDYFKQAMIYALRYNRFLLDEVLSGRPQGAPLHPIIPYCLERGEDGRQILIALRDWWKIGFNDIGTRRPDTISPIPEGIPLLEAERIAREREPGDGSPQKSVFEQIEVVL